MATTSLTLKVTSPVSAGYVLLQFANSFAVSSSTSLSCVADGFSPVCSLQLNPVTSTYQLKVLSTTSIPSSFNLTVSSLQVPATIPTDYTSITSYTADNFEISANGNIIFTTYCTFPCNTCPSSPRSQCLSCYSTTVTPLIYLFNSTCVSSCPSGYYIDTIYQTCSLCAFPCSSCSNSADNCTACSINSTYKYLNKSSGGNTCVSDCPAYMFADNSQIPYVCSLCILPCAHCSSLTNCTTCASSFFYYNYTCLTLCPSEITVTVGSSCIDCSLTCAKCSGTPTNCTVCGNFTALYNGSCVGSCPSDMTAINSVCTQCDPTCLTCSIFVANCTSCNVSSSHAYSYDNQCLVACPYFYYSDSFKQCLSCAALSIGCKNCSSATTCL